MRSLTLRTVKPGISDTVFATRSACSASMVSQVTSITTRSYEDSTISKAVSAAPCEFKAVVIAETGLFADGPSTRIVIP